MVERVALITGASAGIGYELAKIFAANGARVALVARRVERLQTLAAEITAAGGKPPLIVGCDLQRPDSGDEVAQALEAAGVEVEYLVNNAGYGLFGESRALDRADQLGMVDLNVRSLTDLSLRFADQVIRHKGGILNVASIASFLPGPRMSVYYATKAYVLSFSEALFSELGPHGVRVTALCPGPVHTEFQARAGVIPGFDSKVLNVTPYNVAMSGYRALMAGRRIALPGWGMKLIPRLLRFVPRGMVVRLVSRVQSKR
jgi:short-subunit dehydrogenase